MQKNIALIGGVAIIAILGIFTWQKNKTSEVMTPPAMISEEAPTKAETENMMTATTTTETMTDTMMKPTSTSAMEPSMEMTKPTGINEAEVAKHNSETDCYTIVHGKVYNVTNWISKHPGGERAIIGLCGKDGTSAFTGKHGGQEKPEAVLASFYVADLAK